MIELIVIGAALAPAIGIGGLGVRKSYKRKKKKEEKMEEYNWHFPETYWNMSGIYPVSHILLRVAEEGADFQPWMGEVKRYEGNHIESEEIQERFWLNLVLVNEKYESYQKECKSYEDYEHYKSDEFNRNFRKQLDALKLDILERCQDCFEMMKADSVAERQERLTHGNPAPIQQLQAPEVTVMGSEEKALLHILQSPKASEEMKLEASRLLEKWKTLHVHESRPSAEEESMRIDLLTIRNIIEGKEVKIADSAVLSEIPKQ